MHYTIVKRNGHLRAELLRAFRDEAAALEWLGNQSQEKR